MGEGAREGDLSRIERVRAMAAALKGDGCTSSPDFAYADCCHEHDIHYRTGKTVEGDAITRAESDKRLRQCMKAAGKTPIVGRWLLPWWYWLCVRVAGGGAWQGDKKSGGDRGDYASHT